MGTTSNLPGSTQVLKATHIFKYCADLGTSFLVLPKAVKHVLVWFNCMTFQLITVLIINLAVLQISLKS